MSEAYPPGHKSGFVAVIGRPNVGKSTLVNRLVGTKVAIVSPKPQTTRGRILGILTRRDAQVIFVDTPGLHRPRHALGHAMVAAATGAIADADLVLFVVDVSVLPTDEDRLIAGLIREHARAPVILVLNKMDRLPPEKVEAHTRAYWALVGLHPLSAGETSPFSSPSPNFGRGRGFGAGEGWMMTTATRGINLDKLLALIIATLPEGPRYYPEDQITDQTEREIAAELVREQVLRYTRQEIPHAVAVVVTEFKERESGVTYIAAQIWVEKESQKGIVIGRDGQMLKQIGAAARQEIEFLLGRRVYLDLHVKVREGWRRDEKEVQRLGYGA